LGEPRIAIEFCEQAIVIDREIGDQRGEGHDLFTAALALDKLGDRAQTIAHAEEALKICEAIEHHLGAKVRTQLEEWKGIKEK
jgi:tetratricopeptide (TPR) repeat protein